MFTDRRFLTRLVMGSSDLSRLTSIDNDITKCLADLQTSLHISGLELQWATYDEVVRANAAIAAKIEALGGKEVSAPCQCQWKRALAGGSR